MPEGRPLVPTGVLAAACTPFDASGHPDASRFVAHLGRLRKAGCDGVLVAGTTGEGPSLSVTERRRLAEWSVEFGGRWPVVVSTSCASLEDTVELTRHAFEAGAAATLVGPPFFYKEVQPEGLLRYFLLVMEAVPDDGVVLLYHVPQETMVPITLPLIERLIDRCGPRIQGIKDSAGDLERLLTTIARFPTLKVYTGAEPLLEAFIRGGGSGAISGMANTFPGAVLAVVKGTASGDSDSAERQRRLTSIWKVLTSFRPYPPAIKGILGGCYDDRAWEQVRPPLEALAEQRIDELANELRLMGALEDTCTSLTQKDTSSPSTRRTPG